MHVLEEPVHDQEDPGGEISSGRQKALSNSLGSGFIAESRPPALGLRNLYDTLFKWLPLIICVAVKFAINQIKL